LFDTSIKEIKPMRAIFYKLDASISNNEGEILVDDEVPFISPSMIITIDGESFISSTMPDFIFETDDRGSGGPELKMIKIGFRKIAQADWTGKGKQC
jgi:hypothetical protein